MLTDASIRSAKPGILWDQDLKGFGIRIGKNRKTFIVLVGSGRRHSIGVYPDTSLAAARAEAKKRLARKQLGHTAPKHAPFADVRDEFLTDCESRLKPLTVKLYRYHLTKHLPFKRAALASLTTRQITQALRSIKATSEREHAIRISKTFFQWALKHGIIDQNPITLLEAPPTKKRERVLSDDELRCLLKALQAPLRGFKAIIALCLYTGARRGEIANLRWSWITKDRIIIDGEFSKNGLPHTIPLTKKVKDILADIPKTHDLYVFPATRMRKETTTVYNGWGKDLTALQTEMEISDFTIHDIRRTFATGMQALGIRMEVTEALLNHVSGFKGGVQGIYQRHQFFDEKLDALLQWEVHLSKLTAA